MRPDAYAQQLQNQQTNSLSGLAGVAPPKRQTLSTIAGDLHTVVGALEELANNIAIRVGVSHGNSKDTTGKIAVPSLLTDYDALLQRVRDVVSKLSDVNAVI